ncbi:MAG: GtrA family protein [Bacteroidales bacterium]|nr:GtrA family protein [Bacteroidales bacterium]
MAGIPSLKTLLKDKPDSLIGQLLRYAVVGGISFMVDYGSLWLLTEKAGLPYLWSAAIAFILGLICNYLLSTAWVFGESRIRNAWGEFLAFAIIGVIGLGLNELIMYGCTDGLGFHYMLSKIVSTGIVFFWNFLARRFLVFKS